MVLHRAFDEVFRSWSHVAVLRVLVDTTTGFSGNETARMSGMTAKAALKALTTLENLGIVHRRRGGREHLFTLNREHSLVKDIILKLYHTERQFPEFVYEAVGMILKSNVLSAIVFGSVVRQQETAASDLDVCCIVRSEQQKEAVREVLNNSAGELHSKFNIKVAPIVFTVEEFRKRAQSKNPLVQGIIEQGRLLTGKQPKAILRG